MRWCFTSSTINLSLICKFDYFEKFIFSDYLCCHRNHRKYDFLVNLWRKRIYHSSKLYIIITLGEHWPIAGVVELIAQSKHHIHDHLVDYIATVTARVGALSWYAPYNGVIMGTMGLKSPASPLFTQPFIRTQIKENIKAPRHWPLCWEFTGPRWIPRTNGQ